MASDVSHPSQNLPLSWKGRLSEQQPLQRPKKTRKSKAAPEENTSPAGVVIEPTKPVTDRGLPAFKIKQEIDRQPTADDITAAANADRVTTRLIVGLVVVAVLALGVAGMALLG